MLNGVRFIQHNLLLYNKQTINGFVRRSLFATTVRGTSSLEYDNKLIRKGDFRGVAATFEKNRLRSADIVLSKIQESLRKNYRISGEFILIDVVRELENENESLINLIERSPERWLPLLISSCGYPLSNIQKSQRTEIVERMWTQLNEKLKILPVSAWNTRFQVLNENESDWNPVEELERMERSGVEPNVETFRKIISRIAFSGDVDGCRNMVYNMARRGFAVDEHINASSVFVFSLRGHYKKADSLCEQAATKYGENGVRLANGAVVRAAACRGDNDRLRQVLRRSVNEETKKLNMSTDDIFETIWQMAEKSRDGSGAECFQLIEQMFNCTSRESGFFRRLFREIERHIVHRHYYTALSLLEDTKKVSDCLENQQRNLFLLQLVGRLSTQLIKNQEPIHIIRDIANRVHFAFNNRSSNRRIRMYDDLMYATLMLKELDLDTRIEYFRCFADEIDTKRERIHISLPLLTTEESIEQKLAIVFHLSNMGYRDWSLIDIDPLISVILQPLYNSGRSFKGQSKLDKIGNILKSYGIKDTHVWFMFHKWAKRKLRDESRTVEEQWVRPYSKDLKGWCRAYYSETFENPKSTVKTTVKISYDKFKTFVEQGDIAKVSSILSNNENGGWPADTNFEEIVPQVISLYLNHETWKNVQTMLTDLSVVSSLNKDPSKTAVKNYHLLNILRRLAEEGDTLSIRALTDYAYELRNLYPYATSHYDGFFETQNEYKRLFVKFFERLEKKQGLNSSSVEELIDFLRCLVKLDIIQLHPTETLTVFFINIVLKRIGWNEAVNTWQKFLSGLHCPNGTVALLRYCLQRNTDEAKKNMQFVIHRGSTFLSQSRMAAIHLSVLIGIRKFEEAEKICNQTTIEPNDCLMAMRLMNALKARTFDEQFMLDYASICLRKLNIAENKEVAQNMQADLLRICDQRHMGPAALRVYELFAEYDVKLGNDEKTRLATVIEKHGSLSKKWIYKPNGFLNISADDDIITKSDEAKIEERLKIELANG